MEKITIHQALERPPKNCTLYKMSKQLRVVPANQTTIIPIFKGKEKYSFVLKEYKYEFFNQLSEQDVLVALFLGSTSKQISGRWDLNSNATQSILNKYPWMVEEARNNARSGVPYDVVSNSAEKYYDHACSEMNEVYLYAEHTESVYLKVTNQSSVHDHPIEVSYLGWSFSPNHLKENK